jgi:hypothetical protein
MGVSNYLPSSRLIQPGVCTSTTRPASPFVGQAIYETDTKKKLTWDGSGWYPDWNIAWGTIGYSSSNASQNFDNDTEKIVDSQTVTIIPGRRYKISGRLAFQPTGTADFRNALYVKCSGMTTRTLYYSTAAISQNFADTASGFVVQNASDIGVTSGTGTSKTFELAFFCGTSGNININPDAQVGASSSLVQFLIEDIGPA